MIVERIQTPMAGEVVKIEVLCADLDGEPTYRYSNKCSEGCAEGMLMFFTPKLHGSTIHARVCAGRFEFVCKLSREWWARKAAAVLGWDEDRIREEIDPVWAMKVRNKRVMEQYSTGTGSGNVQRVNNTGPKCIGCGKKIGRGFDLCNECADGPLDTTKDYGSFDDL